jgi:CitB family two-component system response regulator MalR
MARNLRPHLVLLDLGLPGGDGIALLRHLRARGAPIDVIVVTAATRSETVRATVRLGIVDYLVKPFEPERLRKSLGVFQRRHALVGHHTMTQDDVDLGLLRRPERFPLAAPRSLGRAPEVRARGPPHLGGSLDRRGRWGRKLGYRGSPPADTWSTS